MNTAKKIIIDPAWNEIEKARNKLSRFLIDLHISEDYVQAATMTFSELTENGVKYGKFLSGDHVEMHVNIDDHLITIEVIHPIDTADRAHLRELDKMIQWIRGYQDPFEAYIEKLEEIAKRPIEDKESGLGLVRIAYEGSAVIDFYINEDSKLNVSAVLHY